jgi:predicted enzyme related to lactoylglutathione lyase
MPEMTSYTPGMFCWDELATSNHAGAKEFYKNVFGWNANDSEYGPGNFYTTFELDGKGVAGGYGMDQAQLDRGIPPHWNVYVAVASADEATAKAKSLGANVMMEPFDVMEHGRMSVVMDPTGAAICLWQGNKHIGAQLMGNNSSFCWWELNTKDVEAAKKFYTALFGWEAGGDPNYTEWKQNGVSIGGMMQIQPEWGPVPPNWMPYVAVADADGTVEKIKANGGSIMMGPQDIPNMGRFAVCADGQRAPFAIFQSKM